MWLVYWAWMTYLAGERTLPRLAVVLGLTSFAYGAIVGVLIQVALALEITILPGDQIGAHASAMTFGYLVLTAMGFIEWRLLGTRGMPTLGVIQVVALFLGGLVISIGLLAGGVGSRSTRSERRCNHSRTGPRAPAEPDAVIVPLAAPLHVTFVLDAVTVTRIG